MIPENSTFQLCTFRGSLRNQSRPTGDEGIYRSIDNGNKWTRLKTPLKNGPDFIVFNSSGHIFLGDVGISAGVYRSTNNGASWTNISKGLGFKANFDKRVSALAISPNGTMFAVTPAGVFRSSPASGLAASKVSGDSAQTPSTQEAELEIRLIKNSEVPTEDPCACNFNYSTSDLSSESQSHILWIAIGERPYTAFMNINGKIATLKLINSTWTQKYLKSEKKGSSFVETYVSGDIKIRITYVVSRMYGEGALYAATIVVTKGNQSKILKAFGDCAC